MTPSLSDHTGILSMVRRSTCEGRRITICAFRTAPDRHPLSIAKGGVAIAARDMARISRSNGRRLLFCFLAASTAAIFCLLNVSYRTAVARLSSSLAVWDRGYVLALKYSDQLTGGAINLLSLMCLATEFGGVRVVEPFLVNSDFGLNASKRWTEQLKFRDINDISVWREYVSKKHYNPLVSYTTFMKDAPRKVLLVQYYYSCGNSRVWKIAREFCDSNGFELIDNVCLTYGEETTFTVDTLNEQIYSLYKPSEVVVLFEIFGGIVRQEYSGMRAYRLSVRDTRCERAALNDHNAVEPSPSVFSDADAYIERYLKGDSYISVMIRLERILLSQRFSSNYSTIHTARQCLNNVLQQLRDTRRRTGITATFLTIDVGTYGSKGFHTNKVKQAVLSPVEEFFSAVYDNKTSLQEWEDSFSSVGFGRSRSPGYIAMMQKVIAVKGDILMLVGSKVGSSFQMTSRYLYHKIHGRGQVIELSSDCT